MCYKHSTEQIDEIFVQSRTMTLQGLSPARTLEPGSGGCPTNKVWPDPEPVSKVEVYCGSDASSMLSIQDISDIKSP